MEFEYDGLLFVIVKKKIISNSFILIFDMGYIVNNVFGYYKFVFIWGWVNMFIWDMSVILIVYIVLFFFFCILVLIFYFEEVSFIMSKRKKLI